MARVSSSSGVNSVSTKGLSLLALKSIILKPAVVALYNIQYIHTHTHKYILIHTQINKYA